MEYLNLLCPDDLKKAIEAVMELVLLESDRLHKLQERVLQLEMKLNTQESQ